jgi:hypothetical protein
MQKTRELQNWPQKNAKSVENQKTKGFFESREFFCGNSRVLPLGQPYGLLRLVRFFAAIHLPPWRGLTSRPMSRAVSRLVFCLPA